MSVNDSFYSIKKSVASGKIEQLTYTEKAKARKTLDVLVIPDRAIADASAAQLVGKGSLLRVEGTSGGFITFGGSLVAVPSASTENTLKTPAGFFFIVATDDYVRTSAAMRIEVVAE